MLETALELGNAEAIPQLIEIMQADVIFADEAYHHLRSHVQFEFTKNDTKKVKDWWNKNHEKLQWDYEYSHYEWAKHHNLPFKLVADHSHELAKKYSSYNDLTGFNRRTVYVIDKQGKIAYIDLKYSTRDMVSFEKLQGVLTKLK